MSDDQSSGGPAAGWYDDPETSGQQRYWDGSSWTEHRSPKPASAEPGAGPRHTAVPTTDAKPIYRRWWFIAGIAVLLITIIGSIGGGGGDGSDPLAASPDTTTGSTSSVAPESSTTSRPTTTTTSTSTTSTTTTTTTTIPLWEPFTISGSGDDVVDAAVPNNDAAVLRISYEGGSNFAVKSYSAAGDYLDLLVNEIGAYSGSRPVNLIDGEEIAELDITASGPWSIDVVPLLSLSFSGDIITGSGPDVFLVNWDGGRVNISHSGDSNFVVRSYGDRGVDLMVNEIGAYSGTSRVDGNVFIVEVEADGAWELQRTS